tara:strand:+ start:1831 stop:2775 length:945 start_codon:yes stop_codon:yes gene_type:complete
MKKILIAGAAGFIGSNLCDFFLKKNFFVIGLDNLSTGRLSNISHNLTNKKFLFKKHDITKSINIKHEIDYILNFASPASPINFEKIPFDTINSITIGTKNLLDLAVKKKSIILIASTSEIYGNPLMSPQNESYFGNVNTISPRAVYDESKRFSETLTYTYKRYHGLQIRIARIFNTYGPRMKFDDGRVIPNFFSQLLSNKNLTVYGNGLQTRSFCFIDDMVMGIYKLLNSNYSEPINLGNDYEISIKDLVNIFKKLFNYDKKIIFKKLPTDDPLKRKPNIDLAIKKLRWKPKTSLNEGLVKTSKYFIKEFNNNS